MPEGLPGLLSKKGTLPFFPLEHEKEPKLNDDVRIFCLAPAVSSCASRGRVGVQKSEPRPISVP